MNSVSVIGKKSRIILASTVSMLYGITVVSLTLQCKQKGFNRGNGGEKKTPRDLIDKRLGR